MDSLPEECIVEIFKKMSIDEIANTIHTSKRLYNIYKQNETVIYKHLLERDFNFTNQISQKNLYNFFIQANTITDYKGVQYLDPYISDVYGRTRLHVLCENSNGTHNTNIDEIISLLAIQPNLVNARDKEGNTALHYAVTHTRNLKTIITLLEHASKTCSRNSEGYTPLDLAFMGAYIFAIDSIMTYDFYADEQTLYLALAYTQDFDYIYAILVSRPHLVNLKFIDLCLQNDKINTMDVQDMMYIVNNLDIPKDVQRRSLDNLVTLEFGLLQ